MWAELGLRSWGNSNTKFMTTTSTLYHYDLYPPSLMWAELNCQNGRTWLWFYINQPENGHKVWWKCPCQITEVIVEHIRGGKKHVHLEKLVNKVRESNLSMYTGTPDECL